MKKSKNEEQESKTAPVQSPDQESQKCRYIIVTSRTEYSRCRYVVEARNTEEAEELFHLGDAQYLDENSFDAEDHVEEVFLDESPAG